MEPDSPGTPASIAKLETVANEQIISPDDETISAGNC